ncbi:phage holin family protein [Eggerthellaceae bacterium zg-1084]|uniref:Phage holin family protein n=1 Tax=Berryella wangjianweii TaxID=2734634 RepID=A0A6M8JAJ5_9ACTN|nr:phage holin family protein [Berryella wangjianweii]NPD31526.1 phage holin family protein [Berryella wangjianweii]NPD32979.1 phage holin family protein [Eggerthellaceae bacterium zg-997]QKF07852.1 phage holin family protein [Berryella wangjianweii]
MNLIARWLITTVACAAALWLIPGIGFNGSGDTMISALILGLVMALVNTGIKPLAQLISLPFTVLTLGAFYLVVNTLMVYLAVALAGALFGVEIQIANFFSALLASIVISIVSSILNNMFGQNERSDSRR